MNEYEMTINFLKNARMQAVKKMFMLFCIAIMSDASLAQAYDVPVPVTTDSRIKTFVYNENEVFNVVTHYGYQSNIEFSNQEDIDTISLGDRVPFQIIPSGRRLFIRALTANARTNMTVVTNKRTYQFDLAAVPAPSMPNEELVYVVKFFYPDDKKNSVKMFASGDRASFGNSTATAPKAYNYQYTFSGSDSLAPAKIYDDGKATYFKFAFSDISNMPRFYIIDLTGRETFVNAQVSGEYYVINQVADRFLVQRQDESVSIYNESRAH